MRIIRTSTQRNPADIMAKLGENVMSVIVLLLACLVFGAPAAMAGVVPEPIDVTSITGQEVTGPVTSWRTHDGPYLVEHLAGQSPKGDLLVFWWSPRADWQVVNVSDITGARIVGPITNWQTQDGPYTVEHLAGKSFKGDLLVFWWSPRTDWQVVNVSQIAGARIIGSVTDWQTQDGPYTVEHLAGQSPDGSLLVFWWSPRADWQVVNVSKITREHVAGPVTSWVTNDGPYTVEHLAGRNSVGDLMVFWWSPRADWQAVNVSKITGQQISGSVVSWITHDGDSVIEHLAGTALDGQLCGFWWSASTDWRVVNITHLAGSDEFAGDGVPSSYQLADGDENVELLGSRSKSGSLLLYWWKPSRDWQSVDLSEITGRKISADPESWISPDGDRMVEHLAAPDPDGHLLVFWGYSEPRRLTDRLGNSFQSLKRVREPRKVLAILWDPHRPTDPAPSRSTIEDTLFGATNSVRDYFLENSDGLFTVEKAGVLGWYDADKPADHYWNENEMLDMDGDGWLHGHVEKWAEAIRKADLGFDFSVFDINRDGVLAADELGILIVIPASVPFGTNRGPAGRESPTWEPLVVDGVRIPVIAEAYIGSPPNIGLAAHELSHLVLDEPDMYATFFNSAAAGDYSLMDRTYKTTHLDPFNKLKLGWAHPKIIFRGGSYELPDVETSSKMWILLDPARGADEYFIVENRWTGTSYDREMADDGGLAVWHIMEDPSVYGSVGAPPFVDPTSWDSLGPGDWGRRAIMMVRPILTPPLNDRNALWDGAQAGTDYDLLSSDTNRFHARLRWANRKPSGFSLRQISAAGPRMSARIDIP